MASASVLQSSPRKHVLRHLAQALEAAAEALRLLAEDDEQAAPIDKDRMLTVGEAASLLKRSPAFVRARCRSKQLKAMRDGEGWRIRQSALAAYERRRTR